jgi:hypothetical protein
MRYPQAASIVIGLVIALFAVWIGYQIYRRRLAIALFFADLVTPFATIARELRRANDLKVLELSERINPFNGQPSPIIPITEEPSKSDTEVTFGVGDENKMTLRERMVDAFNREALDDE